MIRTLTPAEMASALGGHEIGDILRAYSVCVHIVPSVDNQGEPCGFCGDAHAGVAVNVYATNMDGFDQCADCCPACIPYVLDDQMDICPTFPVVIELAQGCR